MSEFKVGDRVRVTTNIATRSGIPGSEGVIISMIGNFAYAYRVKLDDMGIHGFDGHELELVTASPPAASEEGETAGDGLPLIASDGLSPIGYDVAMVNAALTAYPEGHPIFSHLRSIEQAYDAQAAEIARLQAELAGVEAERDKLKVALRDIRSGVEGSRGNCQDCDSVAIVAQAALDAGRAEG